MQRQSGSTFLPLRVNSAGMIPLIFAFSIVILPGTIANYFTNPLNDSFVSRFAQFMANSLDPSAFGYWLVVFFTVVVFTFFYTIVTFQQQNLAENLQRQGGFVPGIRPGKPTDQYINRVLLRITWAGAFFLASVAVAPFIFSSLVGAGATGNRSTAFGITSAGLIIAVGVVLDTLRQIEAQLMMRQYEGFIR